MGGFIGRARRTDLEQQLRNTYQFLVAASARGTPSLHCTIGPGEGAAEHADIACVVRNAEYAGRVVKGPANSASPLQGLKKTSNHTSNVTYPSSLQNLDSRRVLVEIR